jgi:hypothetical protein
VAQNTPASSQIDLLKVKEPSRLVAIMWHIESEKAEGRSYA